VVVAGVLGACLGLERELRGHVAGIRTHALVAIGAAVFSIAGDHESGAELLGHLPGERAAQPLHLLFGVVGVIAAPRIASARTFLIAGGIVYLALLLYGIVVEYDSDANFVPLDDADNWLHLGLGVGMILLGLLLPPMRDRVHDRDVTLAGTGDVI
jgi:hypothetical protein